MFVQEMNRFNRGFYFFGSVFSSKENSFPKRCIQYTSSFLNDYANSRSQVRSFFTTSSSFTSLLSRKDESKLLINGPNAPVFPSSSSFLFFPLSKKCLVTPSSKLLPRSTCSLSIPSAHFSSFPFLRVRASSSSAFSWSSRSSSSSSFSTTSSASSSSSEKASDDNEWVGKQLSSCLRKVRDIHPVVACVLDRAPCERIADVLLSCGAFPLITSHANEVEEYLDVCKTVYFNSSMQTLQIPILEAVTSYRNKGMSAASSEKNYLVVDATSFGLSEYRNKQIKYLLEICKPNVIKCNAIEALCLAEDKVKGAEENHSSTSMDEVIDACRQIAQKFQAVVQVTGGTDIVVSAQADKIAKVMIDTKQVNKFSGSGCSVGALCAAALASAAGDDFLATYAALMAYKVCARDAFKEAKGPGSLAVTIIDKLSRLSLSPDNLLNEKIEISDLH